MPQAKDGAQPWTPVHLYKMQRLRRGSAARRVVISVIALYAVLLQVIFAPPAAAFGSVGEITCAQNGSRSEAPGGEHHHHGLCSILAYADSASVYVSATAGIVVLPLREASRLALTQPSANLTHASAQFYLPARGPPQAL
jgi:hypothetical protein